MVVDRFHLDHHPHFPFAASLKASNTLNYVNDEDYMPPFPLTAKLNRLKFKVDRPQSSHADIVKTGRIISRSGRPLLR